METLAILSIKGGVGKTTTAAALGGILATEHKARVLAVDLDPQGNLTTGLGLDPYAFTLTTLDVLYELAPAADVIVGTETPRLDVLPASLTLAEAELKLVSQPAREMRLRRALASVAERYDYCIIDTPPSLSVFSQNAAMAARWVLTPVEASPYSMDALAHLRQFLDTMAPYNPTGLSLLGVVLTKMDNRLRLTVEVERRLREALGPLLFGVTIPINVKASEAAAAGQPVNLYDGRASSTEAYRRLAQEILTRLEMAYAST